MAKKNEIVVRNTSKNRTLLGGALVGACAGLIGAFLLNRRASRKGRQAALTPIETIQLGILVIGLLRGIAALGEN